MAWEQLTDYNLKEYVRKDDYSSAQSILAANTVDTPTPIQLTAAAPFIAYVSGSIAATNALSVDSANFEITTTTSGDIIQTSVGDLTFQDQYLSAAIPISESGETGLSGYTATSIVGALNEAMAGVGAVTLDVAYNNDGGAATIEVNAGDVTWSLSGGYDFVITIDNRTAEQEHGFIVQDSDTTDYFKLLIPTPPASMYWLAELQSAALNFSSSFALTAGGGASIQGLSATLYGTGEGATVHALNNNVTLYAETTGNILALTTAGNFGFNASSFATSELGFIAMASGTKPTGGWPGDVAHLGVYDRGGTAGKAAWHMYCEDGTGHVFGDRVGIGTATPEGFFNLHGANASTTGPTFQITTTADAYPLFQIFAYQHDHVQLCFDTYYSTAGNWISSDAGSNYKILKDADLLKFVTKTGVAAGSTIATWTDALHINTSGDILFKQNTYSYGDAYGMTGDAYPAYQFLFFDHDNIAINFDAYYESGWKSSDAGSNFQLYKTADTFKIQYDSGVAQGGAVTWNAGIVLDASGKVGIGVSPLTNMAAGDMVLEGGSLVLKEITTPTADADYGKVYTKNDNKLYFQDGAGAEHEISLAT